MTSNIQQRFDEFLEAHPEAFVKFCELANDLWDRGIRHYGAKSLVETMRYHSAIDARPEHRYKLNNNWTCLLARKYVEVYKDRADFFQLKPMKIAA